MNDQTCPKCGKVHADGSVGAAQQPRAGMAAPRGKQMSNAPIQTNPGQEQAGSEPIPATSPPWTATPFGGSVTYLQLWATYFESINSIVYAALGKVHAPTDWYKLVGLSSLQNAMKARWPRGPLQMVSSGGGDPGNVLNFLPLGYMLDSATPHPHFLYALLVKDISGTNLY